MLLTFKRDEEGRERIYVRDVCVAYMIDKEHSWGFNEVHESTRRITGRHIDDAIELADEAGFWSNYLFNDIPQWTMPAVTVDVPVADNTVLSVTREGDES